MLDERTCDWCGKEYLAVRRDSRACSKRCTRALHRINHPEKKREYDRRYRLNNPERLRELRRNWYVNNREWVEEKRRETSKRPEVRAARAKAARRARLNNPELAAAKSRAAARRTRLLVMIGRQALKLGLIQLGDLQ